MKKEYNIPKVEDIQLEIGLIIGEYRAMQGMPPKKLADKLNISEKDLDKIENGNIEEIINREKARELGWRENKRASGGRHFINTKKGKEVWIDYWENSARIMDKDGKYWIRSITFKKRLSPYKIFEILLSKNPKDNKSVKEVNF